MLGDLPIACLYGLPTEPLGCCLRRTGISGLSLRGFRSSGWKGSSVYDLPFGANGASRVCFGGPAARVARGLRRERSGCLWQAVSLRSVPYLTASLSEQLHSRVGSRITRR